MPSATKKLLTEVACCTVAGMDVVAAYKSISCSFVSVLQQEVAPGLIHRDYFAVFVRNANVAE